MNELAHYEMEKSVDTLRSTVCKGLGDEEVQLFAAVCKKAGLDPFSKQIYPVKRWDTKLRKETMTIQTGIDGFRLIAERTGKYAPGREPEFKYDQNGKLVSATAFVKKQTQDGSWHDVSATAFFSEYVQTTKDGSPTAFWQRMPHNQLAKCAESLALRKAFPIEMSGINTREEMEQSYSPEENFSKIENRKEEIQDEARFFVSEEEMEELTELLEKFPEYKKRMMDWLSSKGLTRDVGCLPIKTFNKVKIDLQRRVQEGEEIDE